MFEQYLLETFGYNEPIFIKDKNFHYITEKRLSPDYKKL